MNQTTICLGLKYYDNRTPVVAALALVFLLASLFINGYFLLVGLAAVLIVKKLNASIIHVTPNFFSPHEEFDNGAEAVADLLANMGVKRTVEYEALYAETPFLIFDRGAAFLERRDVLVITPLCYWCRTSGTWSTGKTAGIVAEAYSYEDEVTRPLDSDEILSKWWDHETKSGERDYRFNDNSLWYKVRRYGVKISLPALSQSKGAVWSFRPIGKIQQLTALQSLKSVVGVVKCPPITDFETKPSPQPSETVRFVGLLVELAAQLLLADGVVDTDEIARFNAAFRVPPQEVSIVVERFVRAGQNSRDVSRIASELLSLTGPTISFEHIISRLIEVASEDRVLSTPQSAIISELCSAFCLTATMTSHIMSSFKTVEDAPPTSGRRNAEFNNDESVETFYLRVLELDQNATGDEVKNAYRRLARRYHPDALRGAGKSHEELKRAEDVFKLINQAYSFLTNK